MSVVCTHPDDPTNITYLKGSIEAVLARCDTYFITETHKPILDNQAKELAMRHATSIATQGLRVLGMAYGAESNKLCFTGFMAMYDPPRKGVSVASQFTDQGLFINHRKSRCE
jgi:Ca2+-transporting ATPase